MVTIVKLIVLIIFIVLSSKELGRFILEKTNKETEETLGIGFLANISLFWIIEFFVMLLKLSSFYLNMFGILYLLIVFFIIIRNIIKYKKISFSKKEIIALVITIILMCLYAFFVSFGKIETYDSYFYSVLTNSASDTESISVINPYTGQNNLQNYYKYISYYYQSTFLGNIVGIQNNCLVLIWVMTFMNYLFIAITGVTLVRATKNKHINNILSAFFFTFLTSIFRAPFNALHLVTMIISIYCFKYMFEMFKDENSKNITLLIISIMSAIAITSTTLFVVIPFLYVFFVVASILKRKDVCTKTMLASIPIIILGFLYIFEALDSYWVLLAMLVTLAIIYVLFLSNKVIKFLQTLAKISVVIIFILLVVITNTSVENQIKKIFIKNDIVEKNNLIESEENAELEKFSYENKFLKLNYDFNINNHSSSMQYIYENNQTNISKILILITHSTILYGGMLALFIYGVTKRSKKPEVIAFFIYLGLFYNPLVRNGLAKITFGLEARIYLFFNTIFSIYGVKYFFEDIIETKIKEKWEQKYDLIKKYGSYFYCILVIFSITAYILNFNIIDINKYNLIYKIPNKMIEANDAFNDYLDVNQDNQKLNSRVFYTANAFNMSMIDKKANKKLKIINSKEYMLYFENPENVLTDKLIISSFFDTEGKAKIKNESNEEFYIDRTNVEKLIQYFNIQYIILKTPQNQEFIQYINKTYETIYFNDEIQILKVI